MGNYIGKDSVTTLDYNLGGAEVKTVENNVFSITKVDNTHIQIVSFNGCTNKIDANVSNSSFVTSNDNSCFYGAMVETFSGSINGNILTYSVKYYAGPNTVTRKGTVTKQ